MHHKITICMGSSCFARGNDKNVQVIKKFLQNNHLEADIEFAGLRCQNECSKGPNIIIDGTLYNRMEKEALIDVLNHKFLQING